MPDTQERPDFYSYLHDFDTLEKFIQDHIRVRLRQQRDSMIDERNTHSYRHGNAWALDASSDNVSEMKSMGAESTIHTIDIIDHNISILEEHIQTIVKQLYGELMSHLFRTVGEAAESVGNTVNRSDHGGDFPAGFIAMLEKIQFGVDRYGHASRPSMYVPPSQGTALLKSLESQPIEYARKVDELSNEKETQAIAREAERISRFRRKLSK